MKHPTRLLVIAVAFTSLLTACSDLGEREPEAPLRSPRQATAATATRDEVRHWMKDYVVVIISKRDRVTVNDSKTTPEKLPAELAELGKKHAGRPVLLILEPGAKPEAERFVAIQAAKSGLGPLTRI